MSIIRRCTSCNKYTMKEKCPDCSSKTINPEPPKFSPQDKYGRYRRQMKREIEMKKG
ncbi:MAG: RNA-protein complex protein Nop10 [DPANN group archaeon]|nr:RNA-protein complex protein Nop10 [DPANN group archaeon]